MAVMIVGMAVAVIGAALGREGGYDLRPRRAEACQHVADDMVAADQDAVLSDLGREVPVAEVPAQPREMDGVARRHRVERLRRGGDGDQRAVLQHQRVAVREDDRRREIHQHLAAVRWWARKIADLAADHMSDETTTLIGKQAARVLTVKGVSGDRLPRGRYIPQSEFDRLIEACDRDPSPAGHRDAALFAVAIATGRRREELASLRLADITQKDDDHWILTFHNTKGNRDLTSDIFDGAVAHLRLWLDRRITLDEGRVFIPILKSGRMRPAGRLSGEALRKILLARWVETGIPEPLTWHDFRRTLISNLIDDTDPVVAQKVVGHKDIKTTALYDRRPEAIRPASLKRIVHVPHKGEIHLERL